MSNTGLGITVGPHKRHPTNHNYVILVGVLLIPTWILCNICILWTW